MEHVDITPRSMAAQADRKKEYVEIIEKTALLSPEQREAVRQLVESCRAQDDIRLSYPVEPDMAKSHYLLWKGQDRQLLSVLAFVPYDETGAECIAFTHPQYRNQGCFSRLLAQVVETYEDCDILFPVSGKCGDTMAALQALGAELESCEHQMQRELPVPQHPVHSAEKAKLAENVGDRHSREEAEDGAEPAAGNFLKDDVEFTFYPWGCDCAAAGTMQTSPVSDHGVCLHHVEIYPEFRGKGMGLEMIRLLLKRLAQCHVRTVVLQVSSDNLPALRLYEKTGFRITETLSYYLY